MALIFVSDSNRENLEYLPGLECVELLDDRMMAAINKSGTMETKYPAVDTLFFKIQGSPEAIKQTAELVKKITRSHGGERFKFAASDQEAADLWQNRKDALFATLASHPGSKCWTTDVWSVCHLVHDMLSTVN